MHFSAATYALATSVALSYAQSSPSPASLNAGNDVDHWCGSWAGKPNPSNVPTGQQLPVDDFTRRFFVEPQLQKTPFSPIIASEPRVQIPKLWGNDDFRIALLSYATDKPSLRVYSSSKSRWYDFHVTLNKLMTECVAKGSGGAWLVPPSPGLTQSTLVVYAYEVGSQFDFQMNYYMSTPEGINPARLGLTTLQNASSVASIPASDAIDYSPLSSTPASSPLSAAPPSGYSYIGCYNDIPNRALASKNDTLPDMTAQACAQFCGDSQYLGTEFGTECFCGDQIGVGAAAVDSSACDMACSGDVKQVCGGTNHLTVYQKETQTA